MHHRRSAARATPAPNRPSCRPLLPPCVLVLALLGLLALGGNVSGTLAQGVAGGVDPAPAPALPAPTLTDASGTTRTPGTIIVAGTGFTPGGRVYLAIYDQMGARLYETRWVTAVRATSSIDFAPGPAPEAHPIVSTVRGGTLREAFGHLCGTRAMMRALDQQTATWSNWLDVQPGC